MTHSYVETYPLNSYAEQRQQGLGLFNVTLNQYGEHAEFSDCIQSDGTYTMTPSEFYYRCWAHTQEEVIERAREMRQRLIDDGFDITTTKGGTHD